MFRGGQPNPYDEIVGKQRPSISPTPRETRQQSLNPSVAKTTDENLTSENWELILNLCDKVQEEGEQG